MNKKPNKNNDNIPLSKKIKESHPYMEKIRASWIANSSHGKKNSPCGRKTLTDYNAGMCNEWSGEMGFLRYYIWHIDYGYIPGKSKIQRKDMTIGFSPENCFVVNDDNKKKSKPTNKPIKAKNSNNDIHFKADLDGNKQIKIIISYEE
ncbi:MAG: hypothetical protein FNP40_10835 [Dehalobacter sp. 4CP]|uniref:hypothetical protein n=1 Tax=Dehalobacter sp. CP TaxID=2594474 RepID=UPI0013CC1743|nr:hypothetical protein [Dehalobacter sp.]NBJ16033.1 hypothetical protein [Dehalobacter sp. 4CP]